MNGVFTDVNVLFRSRITRRTQFSSILTSIFLFYVCRYRYSHHPLCAYNVEDERNRYEHPTREVAQASLRGPACNSRVCESSASLLEDEERRDGAAVCECVEQACHEAEREEEGSGGPSYAYPDDRGGTDAARVPDGNPGLPGSAGGQPRHHASPGQVYLQQYTNLVSFLKSKLDAGFDTDVRDFYDLFGGGGVGGEEGDGKGAVGGGQTGVFVGEEEPEVNAPADLSEQGGGAGDEGGFRAGGAGPGQGGRVKGSRGEHVVSAEREGQGGFTEPGGGGTVRRSRRGVGFRREGYPTRPAEGGGGGEVHTSGGFGPILTPIEDVISPPQQPPRKRARVPQRQPPGTGPGY